MTAEVLRTFLAVDIDDPLLDECAALADRLRGASRLPGARWVSAASMHITLRFFGSSGGAQVTRLRELVAELGTRITASVEVRATSLTGFPSARRAHVLVVELEDRAGGLASLAEAAEKEAVALGFTPEARTYRPHLTLARMRDGVDVSALFSEAAVLPVGRAIALTLYSSVTSPGGPVYEPLARVALP